MTATVTYADHASQSGHWYEAKTCQQIEQVMGSKGKLVKPTLAHARKFGWYPGITTILKESAAPGLVNWQIEQAIICAMTTHRTTELPVEFTRWLARRALFREGRLDLSTQTSEEAAEDRGVAKSFLAGIIADANEFVEIVADTGNDVHASLQEMFRSGKLLTKAHAGKVQAALNCLESRCGDQAWQSEIVATCPLGYGTKVDLFSPGWIIDWKTKDGDDRELMDLGVYDSHWKQLAAGHRALGQMIAPLEECRAAIGYISRTHDAAVLIEVPQEKLSIGLAMFDCNLTHWKLRTGYDPSTGVSR